MPTVESPPACEDSRLSTGRQRSERDDGTTVSRKAIVIRVVQWLIAVAVAIGLCFAARAALTQWDVERGKLRSQIAELEQEISITTDAIRRDGLQRSKSDLEASVPRLANLRWDRIALASLLYAIGLVPPSFLLRRALVSLGQQPRLSTAIMAQLIGHVGKYVPGKAMVVVLRAGVLSRDHVRPLPATISIFLETFLMMAVGAAVAGLVVLWLPVPFWITLTAVCVALLASLPTLPPILKRIVARSMKMSRAEVDSQIGMGLFAAGWGWSVLSWVFIGASFATLITAIPTSTALPPWVELYPLATAAISLAMVIGFASLLPGGAGVRELVLTTVLGVSIGSAHGLLAAIAARLMFMIVEAILAGGSWLWLRKNEAA
jgi:uncharacterized membrane protein YbhN (UPF0104 family)